MTAWKELGGTLEAFNALRPEGTATNSGRWTKVDRPMPALSGWEFQGRITFVNVWATWCGPCQAELPFVQKLHDLLKDRKDVAVLALNIDENPGLAESYMKQHGFSFTVKLARDFVEREMKVDEIPRNWIVDKKRVLRLERGPGLSDGFVSEVQAAIQQISLE